MEISQRYILLSRWSHQWFFRLVPATEASRVFGSQKARRRVLCMLGSRSKRAVEILHGLSGEFEELRQERKSTTDYDCCGFGLAREGLSI